MRVAGGAGTSIMELVMTSRDLGRPFLDQLGAPALTYPFGGQLDRLFADFLGHRATSPEGFRPAFDVSETDAAVLIRADLPGVSQEDVELTVEDDVITVRGERKSESREEKENSLLVERSWGGFQRALRLPFRPGEKAVKEVFKDGVLNITVDKPKEKTPRSNQIPIQKM
ncbi:Hsp20 family protein [bacterium]|nr:Hsp20 family protein [bacterium]